MLATTEIEKTYLAHTRLDDFQNQLRNPSIVGTILDTTMSMEYKTEVHEIYIKCGLYPMAIGYEKDGLTFRTPHLFYGRFTEKEWKKKFAKALRRVFEDALQ